jgi:tetratricopeptide (TPR) repeat protein
MHCARTTVLVLGVAAVLGAAAPAAASGPEDAETTGPTIMDPEADERARQHFLVGRSYFEQARFEEAAREFAEAHRLSGHATLLVNLGMSHERALQYTEAIEAFERYLRDTDEGAEWRSAARERAARLREIRDQRTPAEGDAGIPSQRSLTSRQVWGISVMGAGVAAGVASLVTALRANGIHGRLDDACGVDGVCPRELQGDIDRGRRLSIASLGTLAAALAAGAVGLTLVLVDGGTSKERAGADVSLGVAPGAAKASIRWRF